VHAAVRERGDLQAHAGNDRDPALRVERIGGDQDLFVLDPAVVALGERRERIALSHDVGERPQVLRREDQRDQEKDR
jgi:hypothetical protein